MKTPVILETYRDTEIAFQHNDGWVNATQMAKAFNKRVNNFLRADRTIEYITALETSVARKSVTVIQGGSATEQGTWMHPDLAMEFARWLSPEFSIWCNRVIRRILAGESVEVRRADVDHIAAGFAALTRTVEGLQRQQDAADQRRMHDVEITRMLAANLVRLENKVDGLATPLYLHWAQRREAIERESTARKPRGWAAHAPDIAAVQGDLIRLLAAALGQRQQAQVSTEELLSVVRAHDLFHGSLSPLSPKVALGILLTRLNGRTLGGIAVRKHRSARRRSYILSRGVTPGAN